jgi:FlaA1/EpsC-like NDP-sugar epimerase
MTPMRSKLFRLVDRLNRGHKRSVFLALDVALAESALLLTLMLQSSQLWPFATMREMDTVILCLAPIAAVLSIVLGIPSIRLKAYATLSYRQTTIFTFLLVAALWGMFQLDGRNFTAIGYALFGLIFFIGSIGVRLAMLNSYLMVLRWGHRRWRVVIYGAGTTGVQLAAALRSHESILVVGFIDDDPGQQSMTIGGLRVHAPENIEKLVRDKEVDRVLLAMPSASTPRQMQIAHRLKSLGLDVLALPSFAQLVGTEALIDNLAPVVAETFLGRQSVEEEIQPQASAYADKVVMVTGAGGSIGSELCRQLIAQKPRQIVLFEVSEKALYDIDRELREKGGVDLVPLLGSVADSRAVRAALVDYGVQVVLHAAAYKHVPLVECNPVAGLSNNVLGTRTLADAAEEAGVERFIQISTDKAVRPTNVMGASKRMAELVIHDLAKRSEKTSFAIVRFGNVLGSSGSVVPLFKEQIAKGGPITLTHEDVTRYFMTISEAVQLVLLAGSYAQPGREADVFVLDMGKPMRIRDLAEQMILAAGYRVRDQAHPDGDIEIRMIGLRPGEKLHEELLIGAGLLTTPHAKILRAREASLTPLDMAKALQALRQAMATGDATAARAVAAGCVEGYAENIGLRAEA